MKYITSTFIHFLIVAALAVPGQVFAYETQAQSFDKVSVKEDASTMTEPCVAGTGELCVEVTWSVTSSQGAKQTAECTKSATAPTIEEETCHENIEGAYVVNRSFTPPGAGWILVDTSGLNNVLYMVADIEGILDNNTFNGPFGSWARAEMTQINKVPAFYESVGPIKRHEFSYQKETSGIIVTLPNQQPGATAITFSGTLYNRVLFGAGVNTFVSARSRYTLNPRLEKTTTWLKYTEDIAAACSSASGSLPTTSSNILWGGLLTSGENDWHLVQPNATGRMFLVMENTELAPNEDYEYEVWSNDCLTPVVRSRHSGAGWGERVILNVQAGDLYRSRVFGRMPLDYYTGPITYTNRANYYEAVRFGNLNRLLKQTGLTTQYIAPTSSSPPGGTFVIAATFLNDSQTVTAGGLDLNSITFEVNRLTGNNTLSNTVPPAGGGGLTYSVQNQDLPGPEPIIPETNLPGVSHLDPGESFVVRFEIGLQEKKPFDFYIDTFAIPLKHHEAVGPASMNPADQDNFEGPSFKFNVTEEQLQDEPPLTQGNAVYLPVVGK